jgi:hypothetical protein
MKRSIARHTGSFGNWRAKFKAEPQPPVRKLLYRRRGLSHTLSHSVGHSLSHMTYGGAESARILAPLTRSPKIRRLFGPPIGELPDARDRDVLARQKAFGRMFASARSVR